MYLQTLANRYCDFKVSWNWFNEQTKEWDFTKRRTVLELWSEDYRHPSECRLEKVQHRQAMPNEIFIELDDKGPISYIKMRNCLGWCKRNHLEYCVYKSRKGYHISVLLTVHSYKERSELLLTLGSDLQFVSTNVTWSLEWSSHWKQPDFTIHPIEVSPSYERKFLGT